MIISIKPEFANKIFSGEKSIELRKSAPNISGGDIVIVYCTLPVKAIIGFCRVEELIRMSPTEMWKTHKSKLGIDKSSYNAYYESHQLAVGIVLTAICRLDEAISLDLIKSIYPHFNPPQTFRYLERRAFFKEYLPACGVKTYNLYD
jgi:predicted transcriptional regulator